MSNTLDEIRKLIALGKTSEAIDVLQNAPALNKDLKNNITLLAASFAEIQKRANLNIEDSTSLDVKKTQLNHSLLEFISSIEGANSDLLEKTTRLVPRKRIKELSEFSRKSAFGYKKNAIIILISGISVILLTVIIKLFIKDIYATHISIIGILISCASAYPLFYHYKHKTDFIGYQRLLITIGEKPHIEENGLGWETFKKLAELK